MNPVRIEQLSPRDLQAAIQKSTAATKRILAYLDDRALPHSGQISGATLAAVAGVDSRTWRKWVGGERGMPLAAKRSIICAAGWC